MIKSESNNNYHNGIQKITTIKLVKDSYAYGLTNFYKVGVVWWFIIAVYAVVNMYWDLWANEISAYTAYTILLNNALFFLVLLFDVPLVIMGLNYFNKGRGELKSILSDLLRLYYMIGCSLLVAFAFLTFSTLFKVATLTGNIWIDFLIHTSGLLVILYLACRTFPLIYIAFDKRLGPINALHYSFIITSGHFWSIFSLVVVLGLIMLLAELLQLGVLSDFIVTPIEYLVFIYAYKELDSHHVHTFQTS